MASLRQRMAQLDAALADGTLARDTVARRQEELEKELATVEAKLAGDQARLYSGTVGVIRELQALQAEVDALRRRKGDLEERVLEAMDEREPLDATVDSLEQERAAVEAEARAVGAQLQGAEAEIDAALAVEVEARAGAAVGLPAGVVAEYDRLRGRLGGIGAARLEHGRCGGCHLSLSASELDRLRRDPPDVLVCCEQCGRILVR